jgi:hypothetical protein
MICRCCLLLLLIVSVQTFKLSSFVSPYISKKTVSFLPAQNSPTVVDFPTDLARLVETDVLEANKADLQAYARTTLQAIQLLLQEMKTWQVDATEAKDSSDIRNDQMKFEWQALAQDIANSKPNFIFLSKKLMADYAHLRVAHAFQYWETEFDPWMVTKMNRLEKDKVFIEEICSRVVEVLELPYQQAWTTLIYINLLSEQSTLHHFVDDADHQSRNLLETTEDSSFHEKKNKSTKKIDGFVNAVFNQMTNYRLKTSNDLPLLLKFLKPYLLMFESDLVDNLSDEIDDEEDNLSEAIQQNQKKKPIMVHFVSSQTGKSLAADLIFAEALLVSGIDKVIFHVKKLPSLEGLPTQQDVLRHIYNIANPEFSDIWAVRHFGENLKRHVFTNDIIFKQHELAGFPIEMNLNIVEDDNLDLLINDYDNLAVIKGEENRKLFEDKIINSPSNFNIVNLSLLEKMSKVRCQFLRRVV